MDQGLTISTHALDAEHGRPAVGIEVSLYRVTESGEELVGHGRTDADGRIRRLLQAQLERGDYRIEFSLGGAFFRAATLTFHVADVTRSYHVPVLLAPYSIASYLGS
jgi:5-hydroxyisourate hydrolase